MSEFEESEVKGMCRREFLKGAAIVTGGGLLAGCAPQVATTPAAEAEAGATETIVEMEGPWYGEAPEISESDIIETIETEVLICGAGHGGMVAALSAADQGVRTIVLEKNATPGMLKTYVGAVGTKAQGQAGVEIDKLELVNEMARYGSYHVDSKLIKVWANESGQTVDWLADMLADTGITYVAEYSIGSGYHGVYKCWPVHTKFMLPEDVSIEETIVAKAQELGAEFRFSTPMVKLIRENSNSGRVTGAIAQNEDGEYIQINASNGVLLCTGGYASDHELVTKLNPYAASVTTIPTSWPGDTGDGIKAGIWVGGVKDEEATAMVFDRGAVTPGTKAGYPFNGGGMNNMFTVGSQPFLKVNLEGNRFVNESVPYDFLLYAAGKEKDGTWLSIWDADYWKSVLEFDTIGCSRLVASPSEPPTGEGLGEEGTAAYIESFIEAGLVQKADTLEELADKLMIPAENLVATVARYNDLAEAGVDEDFGKPGKDLFAVKTAPFYGITMGGTLLTTLDGLQINPDAQVLDAEHTVIEGLYAAGDVSGGYFCHNYPELVVGSACGRTMTFARHAVLHMIKAI